MIKLSDYVIKFIEDLGVKHVFMIPGGGAMHLNDSLGRSNKITYICNLHEQASSIAAEAYSRVTNNIGVALVTTGPGGTNTITVVTSAWIEATHMLIISGQVKIEDQIRNQGIRQMGMQEVDIVSIVKPITKYAVMIKKPEDIKYELFKAIHIAKSGKPGPVWIDIPLDIQASYIDDKNLKSFDIKNDEKKYEEIIIEEIIDLINNSERPVLMGGNGIRISGAINEFIKLVDILDIPIVTTWNGIDLIWSTHKLFMGRPGSVGQRAANFVQQNSDLFISIGARLNLLQTGFNYKTFARGAKKLMVDIDENELKKKNVSPDIAVCMDAKNFINLLLKNKNKIKKRNRQNWIDICNAWKKKYPVVLDEFKKQKQYVNTYVFIDKLSDILPEDIVFVPGSSGKGLDVTMQTFKVKKGQRIFTTKGLASMGFGLPASIGACLASNKKMTICVNGDGGFQMNIQELQTIKNLNLPIKIFILDNKGYSTIRTTQKNFFNENFVASGVTSGLILPDLEKISWAYGIKSEIIESNDEIDYKINKVLNFDGPVICILKVDPDQAIIPRQASYQKSDGSMESRPLEDLKPFLSREELKENMLIGLYEEN